MSEIVDPLSILDTNHPLFVVELPLSVPEVDVAINIPGLDFRRANYADIVEALQDVDWSIMGSATDVDDAVQLFSYELYSVIQEHIPIRRPSPKHPWGNAYLRELKQVWSKMLRRYCRYRCPENKFRFKKKPATIIESTAVSSTNYIRYEHRAFCAGIPSSGVSSTPNVNNKGK